MPSGREDLVAEVDVERLAADRLDEAARPVDVDAVFPACRRGRRPAAWRSAATLPVRGRRHPRGLDVAHRVRVPDVVAEPGGVGQQVAQRDRPLGGAQPGRAGGVEPLQHLGEPSAGSILGTGSSSVSLPCSTSCMAATEVIALVIEAMRKTVSSVIAGPLSSARDAERALVEQALVGRRHRHDAGHVLGVDRLPQHAVDAGAHGALLRLGPAGAEWRCRPRRRRRGRRFPSARRGGCAVTSWHDPPWRVKRPLSKSACSES